MDLNNIPYHILFESIRLVNLYHSSSISDLKELKPKNETMNSLAGRGIYASNDKTYASAFCFSWSDSDGISLGSVNKGPWTIEIPKSYKNMLKKKSCSMYTIDSKYFNDLSTQLKTPEWLSTHYTVPVLNEIKYSSCLDCFKSNDLRVKWI